MHNSTIGNAILSQQHFRLYLNVLSQCFCWHLNQYYMLTYCTSFISVRQVHFPCFKPRLFFMDCIYQLIKLRNQSEINVIILYNNTSLKIITTWTKKISICHIQLLPMTRELIVTSYHYKFIMSSLVRDHDTKSITKEM